MAWTRLLLPATAERGRGRGYAPVQIYAMNDSGPSPCVSCARDWRSRRSAAALVADGNEQTTAQTIAQLRPTFARTDPVSNTCATTGTGVSTPIFPRIFDLQTRWPFGSKTAVVFDYRQSGQHAGCQPTPTPHPLGQTTSTGSKCPKQARRASGGRGGSKKTSAGIYSQIPIPVGNFLEQKPWEFLHTQMSSSNSMAMGEY